MFINYIRIALRTLLRQRQYSLTTIVGLGIGMACCLLIMLFVIDELSYDQYHTKKERIYRLATEIKGTPLAGVAKIAGPWGIAAKEQIPEIEAMTRFVMTGQLLIGRDQKRFYEPNGYYTDASVFEIFSFNLLKGNAKTALTEPNSIVITQSIAQKYFGTEEALGQTLQIDNQQQALSRYRSSLSDYKITGILEDIPSTSHFTFPYLLSMASLQNPQQESWTQWNQFYTYLLLKEGTNPVTVANKFKPILDKHLDPAIAANYAPFLQPLTSIHLHSHLFREINPNSDLSYIYVFSSIALLILAISCANFINLATAQASTRAKEIGVRKVNGAIRKQLFIQFLTEAFLISIIALLLAQIIAVVTLPILNELTLKNIQIDYIKNPISGLGIIGITFFTAVLAGSYPALYLAALKPIQVLKGKWSPSGGASFRKSLVVFQFSLSSMLVIGSVIILNQLHFIQTKPLGFDPQQIITIPIQENNLRENYQTIKKELLAHPGIINVSVSGNLPGGSDWGIPSIPEGFTNENAPPIRVMAIDPDFIETYGMEITEGRDFSEEFASDSAAFLINEEAAKQLNWKDPLTKTISMPAVSRAAEPVVGVVKDFHFRSMHEKIGPLLFIIPPPDWYSLYSIKIDSRQTEDVLKFIEQKWSTLDPVHPFTFNFFDASYNQLYAQEKRLSQIVGYFTGIGIFLACLGLYSLASFTTEQRTKEIGIRKVIGASNRQIITMLSKQYLILVVVGFVLALPVGWWVLQQWLQTFAYHVNADIVLLVSSGLLLMMVALLTVGYRSLQAARANPVDSLRNE